MIKPINWEKEPSSKNVVRARMPKDRDPTECLIHQIFVESVLKSIVCRQKVNSSNIGPRIDMSDPIGGV